MKISIKSLALALVLCFGLLQAGYADAPSYSVSVTTPSGPNDIKAGNGTTYYPYTSTATLNQSGDLGELIIGNYRYKWGSGIKSFNGTNSDPNGGFYPVSQSQVVSTFQTADTPPKDLSTTNPTTLRVNFKSHGSYQITLSCTITFDLLNQDGTVNTANLTASGSATSQVEVETPDFTLSDGEQLVIPIEGDANTRVNGYSINGFQGNVTLDLKKSTNPNPADPIANPVGVSGSGSIFILNPGPAMTQMNIKVGPTAIPGTYPLTIYGVGTDEHGINATIRDYATANLVIPKRYVEIDGPWGLNGNGSGTPNYKKQGSIIPMANNRNPDGSISVDTLILRNGAVNDSSGYWYGKGSFTANTTNSDGTSGFKADKYYKWAHSGNMSVNPGSSSYFNSMGASTLQTINPQFQTPNYGTLNSALTGSVANQGSTLFTPNSYTINWHQQFENYGVPTVGQPLPDALIQCACDPAKDGPGGSVTVTRLNTPQNNYVQWINKAGGFAAVAGIATENPYLEAFAAGVALGNLWVPDENSGTFARPDTPSDWANAVTQTRSAYSANPKNPVAYLIDAPEKIFVTGVDPNTASTHSQFDFTVKYQPFYRIYKYTGDHFEADGYKGQSVVPVKIGVSSGSNSSGGSGLYVLYYTYHKPTF